MNPLIAQGISSAVSTAANYFLQDLTNRKNIRVARQNAAITDQFQRALTHDAPALDKSGYQDAGLSVAALSAPFSSASTNATVQNTPATPTVVSPIDAVQAASVAEDVKNKKIERDNLIKQGKIIDEEARGKKIANDSAEREYKNETSLGYLRMKDYLVDYRKNHPDEDDATVTANAPTYMSEGVYEFNMGYTPAKLKREYIGNITSISTDNLKRAVSDKRIADNEVVDALVKLPFEQFNNVKLAAKKLLNDNELFNATKQYLIDMRKYGAKIAEQNFISSQLAYKSDELTYKIQSVLAPLQIKEATSKSDFDWKQILNKMLKGDGDWKDTVRLVVVMLASFLGANQSRFLDFMPSVKKNPSNVVSEVSDPLARYRHSGIPPVESGEYHDMFDTSYWGD
ncbi:M16p1 [Microviridae IME-16]|uniref:M16p1 n=1 Tax=Microviridae IME-16 TaxID=1544364 RepID=UPI0004F81EA5|nr:M16p1 [Microviridae IME-16]AIN52142.1 M16p1 [Microviridae IME-16]